jgi:hypothetical protein
VVGDGRKRSNEVLYAVDDLPETIEKEPNDDRRSAQRVFLPRTLNGRIDKPDDVDVYCFRGKRHQEVVAEVMARCLRSPLDSLLRLTNAKGETVAWNDDFVRKEPGFLYTGDGLVTHHADSYLRAELPKDGNYYLHVSDTSGHGGEAFAYRVRLSEPQPDFALRVSPSTLNLAGGKVVPITIHALRRDGFDGPIQLSLQDAPEGMVLSGGLIQAGQSCVRATVSSPPKVKDSVFSPVIEGKARVGGRQLVRAALPTDDTMQAFLYRHLAPAEEMDVAVRFSRWGAPRMRVVGNVPVSLPVGGTAEIRLKTSARRWIERVEVVLDNPPKGISVGEARIVPEGLAFDVKVDKEAVDPKLAANLIVELFGHTKPQPAKKGKNGTKKEQPSRRVSLGYLPAIPFQVVAR